MPLTPQEQDEADELEFQKLRAEKQAAHDALPHGAMTSSDVHSSARRSGWAFDPNNPKAPAGDMGTAIDIGLEAGIPLAVQTVTSPAAGTGLTSALGAGASVLGNTLAQIRRMVMGEQRKFSPGQTAQAAVTGAIPFAGPEARAAQITAQASRPILRGIIEAGKTGTKMAVAGASGEAVKTLIDEQRPPTLKELTTSTALPAALGVGGSALSSIGQALVTKGNRVAENLANYGDVKPSPGMLMPEELAATEQRLARANPQGDAARSVDSAYQGMADQVQRVAPNPAEGAAIFETASPLIGQISKADAELAKLNDAARTATQEAQQAAGKVREAAMASDTEAATAASKTAESLSTKAFDANLASAQENAQHIATAKITGGAAGVDPATARTLFVEHVAKPMDAAFKEKSAQMYSLVDNLAPSFDSSPILAEANKAAVEITGNIPKKLDMAMDMVRRELQSADTGGMVSLQALRNARSELLRRVNLGEFGSNNEERLIKGVAASITKEIDAQAVAALGAEGGAALKAANKFYSETRPLFDQRGVDVLFNPGTPDEVTRTTLAGMERAGVNADEYKNLQTLVSKIGEFNPDLAKAAQGHIQDTLRRSIIFDASRVNPATTAGGLMVDPAALVDRLDKMARVPGTLEALNLGTPGKVAELKRLTERYPEASKMTSDQWTALLDSPAFAAASGGGASLSTTLAPVMAASQAEAQLVKAANLRAGGKVERAQKAYEAALDTVRSIGGDVAAAKASYEALLKDPTAIAMNNPGIGSSGFNAFASSIFNPKANALTNTDVRAVADALRSSPSTANRDLLNQLQQRYIADKVAVYHSTPVTSEMLQRPDADAVALFFNPTHPGDATNEAARARALLEPAQYNALSAFARTAKAVGQYEKLGVVPVRPGSYDIPVFGEVRRGMNAVADLVREGRYNVAASWLADPVGMSRKYKIVGAEAGRLGADLKGAAQGVGRAVDDRD